MKMVKKYDSHLAALAFQYGGLSKMADIQIHSIISGHNSTSNHAISIFLFSNESSLYFQQLW